MAGSKGPEGKLKAKVIKWINETYTQEEIVVRQYHAATFRGMPVGDTGWPDHDYFAYPGNAFFIEYKDKGEEPSDKQALKIKILSKLGFDVYVCDDYAQAQGIIRAQIAAAGKRRVG